MIATEAPPHQQEPSVQPPVEPIFLARVRLYAQRRVLWQRWLWANNNVSVGEGLAISDEDVDRILTKPATLTQAETDFYTTNSEAMSLNHGIAIADRQMAADGAWQRLRQVFGLGNEECDLLALVIAADLDPWLRRVYAYLHDDATAAYATPWLAAALFGWPSPQVLGPQTPLVTWRLAQPVHGVNNPWAVSTFWLADAAVSLWLTQGIWLDPVLTAAVELAPAEMARQTCLYLETLTALGDFIQAMSSAQISALVLELRGPDGIGKRTLAAQLAATLGRPLLTVDTDLLLARVDGEAASERALRVLRLSRLAGALLYWHTLDGLEARLWRNLLALGDITVFSTSERLPTALPPGVAYKIFQLPALNRGQRADLWQELTGGPLPAPIADWLLTPGEISTAAAVAPAGEQVVVEVCRQILYRAPGELFSPLPLPYTWDDIVLTESLRAHLAELETQARLRSQVYEEWGFEHLCPLGKGITALFAGPSGTGKTMAAQVLARSLGLDLYRVDLAGVVNKYIGETEKRLKQVFEACERANVLLFFDEADALFGQRTQVKDAHDRFANIEIDYLLQRMEQFDGIAVLATNRKGDLDQAFLRRLRFIVDFLAPGPMERRTLWRLALPERTPQGELLLQGIDWDYLANKLNLTGADIKAAALAAAFLACAQGTRIDMRHVLSAARREMAKHGQILRAGDWEV